jgi:hypothetical protein
MTLHNIAQNITDIAGEELTKLGLIVVPVSSQDASAEDHAIEFRDANGREHAVSIQVNSYAPSWSNTSLTIRHVEMNEIEGTRYSAASIGWAFTELNSDSLEGRINEVIAAIKSHNWLMPIDDIDAGIVTDFRWETVIPKIKELCFDGDVRLSTSGATSSVDTVEIIGDDGVVDAKAVFEGEAIIRVSYRTLAGDERILEYNGLAAFEENIDRDLGGNRIPTASPRI